MFSKFENLSEEKQQRIFNAAIREFAAKGYNHASTNAIVKNAEISKGLLFHYFKNKKQLFLYVYDSCLELVIQEIAAKIDFLDKDFFSRLIKAQKAKFELVRQYPDIMNFLMIASMEDSETVKSDMQQRNGGLSLNSFHTMFEDVDTAPFRHGLDIKRVIQTVAWAFEGFANTYLNTLKTQASGEPDYDTLFAAAEDYVAFLKLCFYQ